MANRSNVVKLPADFREAAMLQHARDALGSRAGSSSMATRSTPTPCTRRCATCSGHWPFRAERNATAWSRLALRRR